MRAGTSRFDVPASTLLALVGVNGPPGELRAPDGLLAGGDRTGLPAALVHDASGLRAILHAHLGPFDGLKGAVVPAVRAAFVGILRHFVIRAERRPTCIGVAIGIGNRARRAIGFEQGRVVARTGIADQLPGISRVAHRRIASTREFADQVIDKPAIAIGIARIQIVSAAVRADKPSCWYVEVRAIGVACGERFTGFRLADEVSTRGRIAAIGFATRARFSGLAQLITADGPCGVRSGVTIGFAFEPEVIVFPSFATIVSAKIVFVAGVRAALAIHWAGVRCFGSAALTVATRAILRANEIVFRCVACAIGSAHATIHARILRVNGEVCGASGQSSERICQVIAVNPGQTATSAKQQRKTTPARNLRDRVFRAIHVVPRFFFRFRSVAQWQYASYIDHDPYAGFQLPTNP